MSWVHCRSGCGAHRESTATSVAGEHIAPCHICLDPAYIDGWNWGRHAPRMACKDIPDATFLMAVSTAAQRRGHATASIWDVQLVLSGFANWIGLEELTRELHQNSEILVPWLLVRAKARKLIRRGLLDGCYCGCRGDFEVKDGLETEVFRRIDGSVARIIYASSLSR